MLKIIVFIIIGYILNNFTMHITIILQQMMEIYVYIISKKLKRIYFLKKIIIHFVDVKTYLRLHTLLLPTQVPQRVLNTTSLFIPDALANAVLLSVICMDNQRGRNSILQNRTFYLGSLHGFIFFGVMGQSNWLIVNKQKKLNLGNTARNQQER